MKNYKGNMLLIELVIAILFFSLSQVLIVQVFAKSAKMADDSQLAHVAMMLAEDVAESMRASGDEEALLLARGFEQRENDYLLEDGRGFQLRVALERSQESAGTLTTATMTATQGERTLFSFPSVRYEGAAQ